MRNLSVVITIFQTLLGIAQVATDNSSLFALQLKRNNIGMEYSNEYFLNSNQNYQSKLDATIFKLAYTSGFIIFLENPADIEKQNNYYRFVSTLKDSGYYIYKVENRQNLEFAIPRSFVDDIISVPYLFDGDYADVYLKYIMDWDMNNKDISKKILDNNIILSNLNKQAQTASILEKKIREVQDSLAAITRSITEIEGKILIVDADLRKDEYAFAPDSNDPPIKIPSLLNLFKKKKIVYNVQDDFFISALDRLVKDNKLVNVKDKEWIDKKNVSTPYLHPDLVKAIEAINAKEKNALVKMNLYPLRVTSVARTPYNQAVQIANEPVAAGMFSSGHLCGASVDFGNEKEIIKNYKAFSALMQKYGLYCDPNLGPGTKSQDPKHVYLGKFRGPNADPIFINNLLSSCLAAYHDAMIDERDNQILRNKALDGENKVLGNIMSKMDDHLATVQKKLKDLQDDKKKLDIKLEKLQKDLNLKTKERALREIERKFEREGKRYNDREVRERLGKGDSPRDGYWEKHVEYHSRGDGWECRGSFHENSRGEKWGGYECRSTPSENIGIGSLR